MDFPSTSSAMSEKVETANFIQGFQDVSAYSQHCLKCVMNAIKASNGLPGSGDDYDYYSSFEGFREMADVEASRLIEMIQKTMKYFGVKGNVTGSELETEDKFDVLVDANDQFLERAGSFLDEAAGLKKTETPLVIASTPARQTLTASWNRKTPTGDSHGLASYRLLAARNIQRPQLMFQDKIDNSPRPFVPKIKHKPNALKPLHESLQIDVNSPDHRKNDTELPTFPHPYQYELDHFTPTPWQLESGVAKFPASLESTPFTMVDTVKELEKLVDLLKREREIAVDLEHHSYRSYQGFLCLMQISTCNEDFLIDTLALRSELHVLNEIFTDPNIVKVMHGADSDIPWLQKDLGIYVVNLFDTGQASRVLNKQRHGLSQLLLHYCDVQANKQFQMADWRIRPLPEPLVKYAREDTHYLLFLYHKLCNELIENGNEQKNLLMSVIQRSTSICSKRYEKPVTSEDSHMELYMKSRKTFNNQQMSALHDLYQWRNTMARQEDESTGYILPNHMLLQISEILPKEGQGILACCNPIPPLVRQQLSELHLIVKRARETPVNKVEVIPKTAGPSPHQHPKYDANSLLSCPHDMSQQQPPDLGPSLLDSKLVATTSSMFKSKHRQFDVSVKEKPILSILSSTPKAPLSKRKTEVEKKVEAIKRSFLSPFEKYIPASKQQLSSSGTLPTTEEKSAERVKAISQHWRLMSHTVIAAEPVSRPPEPVIVSEPEEEASPLRHQLPSKTKRKRKNVDKTSKQTTSSEEPPTDRIYNQTDYNIFKEQNKKMKKDVLIDGSSSSDIKGVGKKHKGSSRKKSMTYKPSKSDHSRSTQHWPRQ